MAMAFCALFVDGLRGKGAEAGAAAHCAWSLHDFATNRLLRLLLPHTHFRTKSTRNSLR